MTTNDARPRRLATGLLAAFVLGWLGVVTVPPVVFLRWRHARLTAISSTAAQADWDRFRTDMRSQSGSAAGPVRRKVPRSEEPPERIWLRDYPHVVVTAWIVFVGLLGAVIGSLLRGALAGRMTPTGRVSAPESTGP